MVVPVDPVEYGGAGFGMGGEVRPVDEFALEAGPERLGHRVVIRIADGPHRLGDPEPCAQAPVVVRGVLAAVVAVEHDTADEAPATTLTDGGFEGVGDELGAH